MRSASDADVSHLAERARAGDRRAFEDLVHRMVRPALAAAWELVATREDAEDVVQEAFARTWRELARYNPARPFAPWFFTIVRNVARNASRRGAAWTMVPLDDKELAEAVNDGTEVDLLDRLDLGDRVQTLLAELSPRQRACVRLVDLEGFSREEVADMLGMSPATIRVHLHRARVTLRSRLDPDRIGNHESRST